MSIIIISSDSKGIEQKTAGLISDALGYRTLNREGVLPMVAEKYNV